MNELLKMSARQLATLIRTAEISAAEVMDVHLKHIELVNPKINAIVENRYDDALREAKKLDMRRKKGFHKQSAPLLGVPCTIKESFALTGMPNTSGLISRKNGVPKTDALAVKRLRKAGAIPIGVTNVSELCMWVESNNRVYGRSNNPYNFNRIVGGSSGGEGAIVGSGASAFGLGSDIAGSIRLPAFFNGVFGHKPTGGLVPTAGHFPLPTQSAKRYSTVGPITRYAEDLMPILQVLAGPDKSDPYCLDIHLKDPASVNLNELRIINVPGISGVYVQKELVNAQKKCVTALEDRGSEVHTTQIKSLKHAFRMWTAMMSCFEKTTFSHVLSNGKALNPIVELMKWCVKRSNHTLPAIGLSIYEKIAAPKSKFVEMAFNLRKEMIDLMGAKGVMIFPTYTQTAPLHYFPMLKPFDWVFTGIFNVLEFPATQIPLGFDSIGLPLGVQVISSPGNDHLTISIALELERLFGGWCPPPVNNFKKRESIFNPLNEALRETRRFLTA